jgi:hypothetical protein
MAFHVVYKTTNKINNKYYIGVHSTTNINDNYMGSGTALKLAIIKYGPENFIKEVIAIFDSREEALSLESKLVTEELILDKGCYNLTFGGGSPPITSGREHPLYGSIRPDSKLRMLESNPARLPHVKAKHAETVMVRDLDGNIFKIKRDDWNPNTHTQINRGMITVKDSDGNSHYLPKDDPRVMNGELVHISKGLVLTCPHCNKVGGSTMKRWHFNNCKDKND